MAVLRKFARPLLASVFVSGGYAALRHPEASPSDVTPTALPFADRLRKLPQDPEQLARITGAVQVGAGALLALGRMPRVAAAALAVTLAPAALAVDPFWTITDPEERARQRGRFFADLSLLGALLLAAADTHGKPSLAYRTKSGARHATDAVADRVHRTGDGVHSAADSLTGGVRDLADGVRARLPVN
ncbi:DoxX family protein [Streptomyces sp. NBC_01477]|uniref:DoxX family protein n=1 Tax=Streptomyces sp. NBC_01477 TaxID=2976015 RepID=UPI002E2F3146|nr:DoxX family membrane protein [Streptomyces sp. NBC_01477]